MERACTIQSKEGKRVTVMKNPKLDKRRLLTIFLAVFLLKIHYNNKVVMKSVREVERGKRDWGICSVATQ
jgi:hypothetical protein